jgi:hypothetical protein
MAKFNGRLGMILLALYLIIIGAAEVVHLTFEAFGIVMGIWAIVTGVCLLFDW